MQSQTEAQRVFRKRNLDAVLARLMPPIDHPMTSKVFLRTTTVHYTEATRHSQECAR